jgi:hypothetical protein
MYKYLHLIIEIHPMVLKLSRLMYGYVKLGKVFLKMLWITYEMNTMCNVHTNSQKS